MADDNTPADKAATAQGAAEPDLDPATGGSGNPAPAEPPKNKAESEKGTPPKDDKPADDKPADDKPADTDKTDADDTPLDNDVWGSTGDDVGDSVLSLLQNSGLTTEDAKALMYDAVSGGDVSKIDKAALIEKVGKAKATLILAGTENFIARNKAKTETIVKDVQAAVGGEDNWNAVTTWAKANVSEADLSDYREMIDAGGAKARYAAKELAERYNSDSKNTTLPSEGAELTGDGKAAPSGKTLTKVQYVEELGKAHDRGATEAELNNIKAARARGRAAGI